LPDFLLDAPGKGKVRISWVNQYSDACIQLSIQRSYDSANNFRTISSVESPELPKNGFVVDDPEAPLYYYRIMYVLRGSAIYFTQARKLLNGFTKTVMPANVDSNQITTVYFHDTIYAQLSYWDFKKFSDSILTQTRDSLITDNLNTATLKSYIPRGNWIPSTYIYTDRVGNLNINIPDAEQENYSIIFYGADDKVIFNIKHLDSPQLVLDKASFMHSGWFTFEIFENGKLKERNKFFLQKEF